ncbi:MAG: hypothetical protein QOE09_3241 [Ilumatobacteraceae bacterium]
MGMNNKQRRAAKARRPVKSNQRRPSAPHGEQRYESMFTPRDDARALLWHAAEAFTHGDTIGAREAMRALAEIDPHVVERESEAVLLSMVGALWQHGWQPAELIRHARRTDGRIGLLAATAVAADHAPRPPSTLSPAWAEQVQGLALPQIQSNTGWLSAVTEREGPDRLGLISLVVRLLSVLSAAGPLPTIVPPPGAQPDDRTRNVMRSVDDPVLVKVRALLAQAESTTFEAEAEAFTAKAQELMARHAIDGALLWARSTRDERPITIRLPLDDPYTDVKSLLLQRVAHHSRCRSVYHPRYGLGSIVGFASDVAAAEALFTSLLVQSHASLRAEAAKSPPGGRVRSRSFRSSFLLSFVIRIDERLREVTAHVESAATSTKGSALLPALVARESLVEDSVTEMFGALEGVAVRTGSDAAGWARGRIAADQAHLNAGHVRTRSQVLGAALGP